VIDVVGWLESFLGGFGAVVSNIGFGSLKVSWGRCRCDGWGEVYGSKVKAGEGKSQ